jgi:hypothetical protein
MFALLLQKKRKETCRVVASLKIENHIPNTKYTKTDLWHEAPATGRRHGRKKNKQTERKEIIIKYMFKTFVQKRQEHGK